MLLTDYLIVYNPKAVAELFAFLICGLRYHDPCVLKKMAQYYYFRFGYVLLYFINKFLHSSISVFNRYDTFISITHLYMKHVFKTERIVCNIDLIHI